jgi:hypothetical protein
MRRSPIAFAVPMLVALHAAAQEEKPVSDLMAEAKAHFEAQCSLARSSASSAAGARQKDQAIMLTRLNCDCLPAELERVGPDLSAGKANATATPGGISCAREDGAQRLCGQDCARRHGRNLRRRGREQARSGQQAYLLRMPVRRTEIAGRRHDRDRRGPHAQEFPGQSTGENERRPRARSPADGGRSPRATLQGTCELTGYGFFSTFSSIASEIL